MKERRGPRDFLVRAPDQALQGRGGSHEPSPQYQLWGTPPPGRGSPPGVPRAAGGSPARALPHPPRPETPPGRPRPADDRGGPAAWAPTAGVTGPRHLLISYGILAHLLPRRARREPPGPPAPRSRLAEAGPGTGGRKAAPGVPGAEGAVRGRGSEAGSRPALRAAAADAPNPEARPRARLAPSFDHI